MLTHLSLFSGIGGLDLAAEMAGFETVGQCEWADYPTKVLEKHWPHVPRWRDIRTLTGDDFYAKTGRRTVDVISGGFPCQPFSVAGKQKGREDDRFLWPEMLRVIGEIAPRWVIGENVPGILRIAAADVIQDLERQGYRVSIFDFEAAAVGALHRRERVFFVAHCDGIGLQGDWPDRERIGRASEKEMAIAGGSIVCNAAEPGFPNRGEKPLGKSGTFPEPERSDRRAVESGMGGMADGIPNWMDGEPAGIPRIIKGLKHRADRIKCLGNAVVPAQAYPIFRAIRMIEEG